MGTHEYGEHRLCVKGKICIPARAMKKTHEMDFLDVTKEGKI